MGQYFKIVNLDKCEYIDPPGGMKLWEICANNTIRLLGYLLATNNPSGTGILKIYSSKEERERIVRSCMASGIKFLDKVIVNENGEVRGYIIPHLKYFGRWCGDRIALIGDYAHDAPNAQNLPDYFTVKDTFRDITAEVVKEFNWFIEDEDLKVSEPEPVSIDMIITSSGAASQVRKRRK